LYGIVSTGQYQLYWPEMVDFFNTTMLHNNILLTKADMIKTDTNIAYVYDLIHAWVEHITS